jgi:prophage regulatory protein
MYQKYNEEFIHRGQIRILRIKGVVELCGLSKSYIYALIAEGLFPKGVLLVPGGIAKGWPESEIVEWIEQRIAERDQEAANV